MIHKSSFLSQVSTLYLLSTHTLIFVSVCFFFFACSCITNPLLSECIIILSFCALSISTIHTLSQVHYICPGSSFDWPVTYMIYYHSSFCATLISIIHTLLQVCYLLTSGSFDYTVLYSPSQTFYFTLLNVLTYVPCATYLCVLHLLIVTLCCFFCPDRLEWSIFWGQRPTYFSLFEVVKYWLDSSFLQYKSNK